MVALKFLPLLSITTAIRVIGSGRLVARTAFRGLAMSQAGAKCFFKVANQACPYVKSVTNNLTKQNPTAKRFVDRAFEEFSFYQGEQFAKDVTNMINGTGNGNLHIFTWDISYLWKDEEDLPAPSTMSAPTRDSGTNKVSLFINAMKTLAQIFKDPNGNMEKYDKMFNKMSENVITNTDLTKKDQFKQISVANSAVATSVKNWANDGFPNLWNSLNKNTGNHPNEAFSMTEIVQNMTNVKTEIEIYENELKEQFTDEKLKGVINVVGEEDMKKYIDAIWENIMEMMFLTEYFVREESR